MKYLIENKFIKLSNKPIFNSLQFTDKYMEGLPFREQIVFLGEHNVPDHQPSGFVRIINQHGNIFEGNHDPDCSINGFCITYVGPTQEIKMGWYTNDDQHGNFMILNVPDMAIKFSGWFTDGKHTGPMKDDPVYKKFKYQDILLDKKAEIEYVDNLPYKGSEHVEAFDGLLEDLEDGGKEIEELVDDMKTEDLKEDDLGDDAEYDEEDDLD